MLDYELTETGTAPEYCVIWLHGLGADGFDFYPVVPQLNLAGKPAVRFIFPHAPRQPVTINAGYVMRAWYDVISPDLTAQQDKAGILKSAKLINGIIQDQVQQGIDTNRIILAGFSQGGAMALHIGLRAAEQFAGIIALSCYLPLINELAAPKAAQKAELPIFMGHGTYDPVVPFSAGQVSKELLETLGYQVEWKTYAMEHSVCAEEIADISQWLKQVIARR
ncbi:MAG: alpha/beta hydrolase [Gammaproteobacteria bacterium]|nr:alpha/beta hydrolase [Gammaproteobacteria bacterium]